MVACVLRASTRRAMGFRPVEHSVHFSLQLRCIMTHSERKEYASPRLRKYGAVEEITQGSWAQGPSVDADFVSGPPEDDVSFS